MRWLPLILAFALLAACGGDEQEITAIFSKDSGGLYLAMGDSIAAGAGASNRETTSYVALVHAALQERYGEAELQKLAVGGHTTQDLIDEQLPAAVAALEDRRAGLVTITIGGNDLNIIQASPDAAICVVDVRDAACPVADVLIGTEERLDRILSDLRDAGPDATIVIQVYPSLFSGTGHEFEDAAEVAFGMLDDVIERAAANHDVLIADPRAAFQGRGDDLTHTLDTPPDFHPNDTGYKAIAAAFLEVLGLEKN